MKALSLAIIFCILEACPGTAKDSPGADLVEICRNTCSIVHYEFQSYSVPEKVSYNNPPIATYKIVHVESGAPVACQLIVRYDLEKGTVKQPKNWKFDPAVMPEPGSQWFLFLPIRDYRINGKLHTTGGPDGRLKANKVNRRRMFEALKKVEPESFSSKDDRETCDGLSE